MESRPLEYFPLSMWKQKPRDFSDKVYELRNHVGKPKQK